MMTKMMPEKPEKQEYHTTELPSPKQNAYREEGNLEIKQQMADELWKMGFSRAFIWRALNLGQIEKGE